MLRLGFCLATAAAVLAAADNNWPQYRGPNASGIAGEDARPPTEFGLSRNLLWKTALPVGQGSPSVWGDRIFVTAFDEGARKLEVIAVGRKDGAVLWRKAVPTSEFEKVHPISSPATSTPVTDGRRVYAYFGSYGLVAYEWDGSVAWEYPMGVAKFNVPDGSGTSPILAAGFVIVARDGPPHSVMVAVRASDGKPVWSTNLEVSKQPGPKVAHATPVIFRGQSGTADQIVLHRAGSVSGFAAPDGRLLWTLPTCSVGIGTPAISGEMVYVNAVNSIVNPAGKVELPPFTVLLDKYDANGDKKLSAAELPTDLYFQKRPGVPDDTRGAHFTLKAFFFLFDRNKDGGLDEAEYEGVKNFGTGPGAPCGHLAIKVGAAPEFKWSETRNVPEVPAPLVVKRRVYLMSSGGILSCLDAETGRVVYRGRVNAPGAYFASPVAAGGRIYVVSAEGVVSVLGSGDSLEILANNDLGEAVYGTPAPVGTGLYVRSRNHLWAFGAK